MPTTTRTSPLSDPIFRRLFTARVVALMGTGLTTIALALLAYDLAGGSAGIVLGTALALKMLAYVGISPIVGGIAHRLPRRKLLITLDVSRAGFVLCLPFVDQIWQVYVLIFVLNACSAGFTPVFQATVPDIFSDEDQYTRALTLSRVAYDLEGLLSPSLAAAALLLISYHGLFALNAVAFLVSALLLLSVQLPAPTPSQRTDGILFNLSYGIRSYLATPRLRSLLLLSTAVACASAMVIVNTVVYVRDQLGGTDTQTALAFAASGGGSMVAALLLPRILERFPLRPVLLTGGVLLVIGLASGTLQPGFYGLLLAWLTVGVGWSLIQTPAGQLLRMSCQPADRSAFFAAQFALSHACWLVAYPLVGRLGGGLGMRVTFGVLAAAACVATVAAARHWPATDEEDLEHAHEELVHDHLHTHDAHHRHRHATAPGLHAHLHRHGPVRHRHPFVIDEHHPSWPV